VRSSDAPTPIPFRWLSAAAAVLLVTLHSSHAFAQAAPKPAPRQPDPEQLLVEALVAADEDPDEVRWLLPAFEIEAALFDEEDEDLDDEESTPSLLTQSLLEPPEPPATSTELAGRSIRAPALPQRGEGSRRLWNPEWRRFGVGNAIVTGVSWVITGASFAIPPAPNRWRGRTGVDTWGRSAFRIEDRARAMRADDASDVLLSMLVSYPFLVDSLIVTYWYRQSHDVAGQMAMITAETLGIGAALQGIAAGMFSRERPYGRDCGSDLDAELDECIHRGRYRSFFSGHTELSFASAGVLCSHHMQHRVFGNDTHDAIACGAGFTLAAATGMLRMIADQHYVTDVATGAAVGTLSGLGLPWLLHYGPLARVQKAAASVHPTLTLSLVPAPGGLGVGGSF
jgi:hypothetical protein